MRWDLFCRVIDNHGDLGVCWRLAADLCARGETVRLWVDQPDALDWMAPPPRPGGIELRHWSAGSADGADGDCPEPHDVVVEAFGCDPPPNFVAAMSRRQPKPLWINLEYLSAEPYVERSHGLPSPQWSGPGQGLTKHFFFPGFSARTGGLLREPGLWQRLESFDRDRWLADRGWPRTPGEQVALLFGYPGAPLEGLRAALRSRPTLLLAAPGPLRDALLALPPTAGLRIAALPWLSQPDFDRALWCADLNLVRGEDSFVRAQWAGRPLLWQIYPQHDGAHVAKLAAWTELSAADAEPGPAARWQHWQRAWNGLAPMPAPGGLGGDLWAEAEAWRPTALAWRARLAVQSDLSTQLLAFVQARRGQVQEARTAPQS